MHVATLGWSRLAGVSQQILCEIEASQGVMAGSAHRLPEKAPRYFVLFGGGGCSSSQPAQCWPGTESMQQHVKKAAACWADAGRSVMGAPQIWRFSLVRALRPRMQHARGRIGCSRLAGVSEQILCEYEAAQRVIAGFGRRLPEKAP